MAATSTSVAFARIIITESPADVLSPEKPEKRAGIVVLPPAQPRAADLIAERVYLTVADVGIRHPEKRGDGLFGGSAEVGANDVLERVVAGFLGGCGGEIDVARSVFLVLDQLLLAQDPEDRADGRVRGRIREVFHDLGDGGLPSAVQDLHNLPFASGEVVGW